MAGLYLKHRYGIPWVADFRDPWMSGQFMKWSWNTRAVFRRMGESLVFKSADTIIVNAPNALAAVVAECPQLETKIHCVTNGFDPALFEGITRRPRARFVIAHTGELYAGRDPRTLLDAIHTLVRRRAEVGQSLCVDFIGSTSSSGIDLAHEIEKRQLGDNVNLIGQVSYEESLQRMVDADVLLLIDSPNRRLGVPAKLYEYFGANRPVLALAHQDSDVHWALRQQGVPFRLADLHNTAEIVSAIEYFLQHRFERLAEPTSSRFTRAATASQVAEILHELPLDDRI
jgi:glycosyltransferase involved in cell wall biosynthesis